METLTDSLHELKPSSPKKRRDARGREFERKARQEIEYVQRNCGSDMPLNGIVVRACQHVNALC